MEKIPKKVSARKIREIIVRIFILIVVLFLLQRILLRPVASLGWPITNGEIITSEVVFTKGSSPGDDSDSWRPYVLYRYSVDEKEYSSDRIETYNFANGNTDHFSQKTISRYPKGMQVDVHYYPEDPGFAVLEPGIPLNDPLPLIMFIMVLIILVCIALFSILEIIKSLKVPG